MAKKIKTPTKEEISRLTRLEMANLLESDVNIVNPLMKWGQKELENPVMSTLRFLKDMDYIYFTCKYVLNLNLLPYQQVILQEMWNSPFPMLVGSRGLGKCVDGNSWVVADNGFIRIKKLVSDSLPALTREYKDSLSLLGENGFNKVEYAWNNGDGPSKKITTEHGYSLEQTLNHPIRVVREGAVDWAMSEDVREGDYVAIDRSETWFPNTNDLGPDVAYILGALLGRDSVDRDFPTAVLSASKDSVAAFIRGLMDIDGHASDQSEMIEFLSKSKNIVETLQFVLLRFGIISKVSVKRNKKYDRDYNYLIMMGADARKFGERIGFGLTWKQDILLSYSNEINNKNLFYDKVVSIEDGQCVTYDVHMVSDDDRSFISNGFISHNSFLLAVYAILRGLWMPGRKIVITGSGFRQSKTIINYIESLYNSAPVLRSMVSEISQSGPHHDTDRWLVRLGESTIVGLPIGDGQKIRGERAHDLLVDEFAAGSKEIFETVLSGFAMVELEPYDKVEKAAETRVMKRLGLWTTDMEETARVNRVGNQSIISGTAYYQFNHFAEYWKRYHGIISSRGDKSKLALVVGEEAAENIDWRDYKIIRMPYDMLPEGYLDQKHVIKQKASVHSGIFQNEFMACFSADSNGFFKRTLIESCVTNVPINPLGSEGEYVQFNCLVRGDPNKKYVFGVDPASEQDKFSIIILELHETHRRIVYCWTTNKAEHTKRVDSGLNVERDFYGFCARKIRDLMGLFPCELICLDSQGGGNAIREALHDPSKMRDGEYPIWEIKSNHQFSVTKEEKPTDRYPGLHVIEMCQFARAEYTAEANHGLRKDFEDRHCLLPRSNDTATLAVSFENDQFTKNYYDTLEDCFDEIEELKDELSTIQHTQTSGTNRDHWDTPEVKLAGSRKGRLRKDRYSSLVMANYAARRMARKPKSVDYESYGGFVGQIKKPDVNLPAYLSGPDWFINPANDSREGVGRIVNRGVR